MLNTKQLFHNHYNITSGVYKEVGMWEGGGVCGLAEARKRLNPPLGLFGLAMSPRSASLKP